GNIEKLTLSGSAASNGYGNDLDNTILGNNADNKISGALGADTLNGQLGNDTYIYTKTADSTATSTDHILGFGAGDKIDLKLIDAIAGTPTNDTFSFIGAGAFTNTAGQVRAYQASGSEWTVEADTNGDGVPDAVADEAADGPQAPVDEGRRADRDAHRLHDEDGPAPRSALRPAAGRGQPRAGHLRPPHDDPGQPRDDVRPRRGGGPGLLALGRRHRHAVRLLRGEPRAGVHERVADSQRNGRCRSEARRRRG